MSAPTLGRVYHGTDAGSAASIRQIGLNELEWRKAAGVNGVDEKGFSVTIKQAVAELWARTRAMERGGPADGVVLEAEGSVLPLQQGQPGQWADPNEFSIRPEDFGQVGPGVFR